MKRFLIDTDWIADYLKGKDYALKVLSPLIKRRTVAISIITYAELFEGVVGSKQKESRTAELSIFMTGVKLLGIDQETVETFAKERHRLRKEGRLLDNFDLLIAATALRHGLTLLTNNVAHYERIRNLEVASGVDL